MIREVEFNQAFLDGMDFEYANSRSYAEHILALRKAGRPSHTWAYSVDGTGLFVWGAFPYWQGVAEVWMAVGKYMQLPNVHCPMRSLLGLVRTELVALEQVWGYHRLFGQYEKGQEQSARIARLLGFEQEGILRKLGTDEADFVMCARVH